MATPFETFVNTELPKRIGTNESPTTPQAGDLPVFTGVGLLTESKTPTELGLAVSTDITTINTTLANKADLVDGKVPASQVPSYVDDVLEYANLAAFPVTGEAGKVYVAIDTNKTYRWSGSTYVSIGSDLALGETITTAYRGDRGKTAYDHSEATGNPHGTTKGDIGLGNVDNTSDADKPISTATQTALDNKQAALADVITANTYGSTTQYPVITFNAKGIATGVTLQTVAPSSVPAYAAGVAYAVGQLVHHQNHIWRVLVAHTGAIPFVNGNLELVGDTFRIHVTGTSYTCQRLGTGNVGNGVRTDKRLALDFFTSTDFTVDISEAPLRVVIRNMGDFTKLLTVSKTATSAVVSFYDDQNNIINTTTGTTSTCAIPLAGYSHVEILNYYDVAYVNLTKQNIIGKFKLRDVSVVGSVAARDDGWLFAGAATNARTITLPDADVDLGLVGKSTFSDSVFRIQDNGDATKQIAFQASGIATGQTKTITMPNADVNLGKLTNSTVAPSNITVTASPFTYQNATAFNGDVIISGGTVSDIEFTRDNTTFYTVGFIEGVLRLSPSDRVRVTYTVAPTMTLVPR